MLKSTILWHSRLETGIIQASATMLEDPHQVFKKQV